MTAICERTGTAFLDDHPCEAWVARYEGPLGGFDRPDGMVLSTDGSRLYLTGSSALPTDWRKTSFVTLAYDTRTGQMLWRSEFGVPGGTARPFPLGPISLSPDGSRAYVAGYATGGGLSDDFVTIAYHAVTGEELWADRYDGPGGGVDGAYHVVASPDGERVYVTGDSAPAGVDNFDTATVAYDADSGARLWQTTYGAALGYHDFADGQALSPDGTRLYTVSGSWNTCDLCGNGNADFDIAVAAYDTTDRGRRVWTKFYDDPEEAPERPQALEISPDGATVYVGATRGGPTGLADHCSTIAYEAATGRVRWEARQAGPNCLVNDLTVSPDGSAVYLATTLATSQYEAATGAQRWMRSEDGRPEYQRHQSVVVSRDSSNVMVVGQTPYDFWTVVYTAGAGETIRRARLDTLNGDELAALAAFSPDGSMLYVSGWTYFSNMQVGLNESMNEDFLTVAYHLQRPPFHASSRQAR